VCGAAPPGLPFRFNAETLMVRQTIVFRGLSSGARNIMK
jgi:hypothetical protein